MTPPDYASYHIHVSRKTTNAVWRLPFSSLRRRMQPRAAYNN